VKREFTIECALFVLINNLGVMEKNVLLKGMLVTFDKKKQNH
jgi:hypothetical protein